MPRPKKYFTEEERIQARKESGKKYRQNNKEKNKSNCKLYYQANKEKAREYKRLWKAKKRGYPVIPKIVYDTDEERKQARLISAKRYRENNPEKYKASQEKFKINNPFSQKIAQNKSYQKHKDRKIKYQKERRKINRDNVISSERKWYANNKDKKSKYQKEYIKRNRALITQRRREYVKNNLEYIRELSRVHTIKRRALKSNLSEYFSRLSVIQVYYKFDYKCFNCKSIDRLSIDHHYPLSLGNPLTINNAVLLCRSCNAKKATKLPESFYSPEQLTDLQDNYGITKQPLKILEQPSLFEARMPKNLERDNVKVQAIKRQILIKKITSFLINKINTILTIVKL